MAANTIKIRVEDESREAFERWMQTMKELTIELRNFARAVVAASHAFQELDEAGNALDEIGGE